MTMPNINPAWHFGAWVMAIAMMLLLFQATAIASPCFTVLSDPSVRTYDDFKDLATFVPHGKKADGVNRFLPFAGGTGNVMNIDFYYVMFNQPTGKTPKQLFKELRQNYATFAKGDAGDFDFGPYGDSDDPNDKKRKDNDKLWNSDDPTNALMSFNLDTLWPNTFIGAGIAHIKTQAGDLQVTCATDTDFIFSTVDSEKGGPHPVAGNRGFGLKDNGDGTWMFYSKAADMESVLKWNKAAHMLSAVRLTGSIFCLGHKFWMNFFPAMSKYLSDHGMTPKKFFSENHGPTALPLQPGVQSPTTSCS
jgi:hypothetical protein